MIREAIQAFEEKYIVNRSAEKEWVMASKGFMPLTPTIMREFNQEIDLAYHITDTEGLKGLKKMQGQKKEISTFRRGGAGIAMGARRNGEFLVSMSGVSSFNADKDFNSQLSRNGYKWLDPFRTDKDYVVNNDFTVKMNKKMQKHFGVKDRFGVQSAVEDLDGKGKAQFVKWYLDESKKLITPKLIEKIRKAITKKQTNDWDSDEFFLGQIKIKEVQIVKNKWDDKDQDYSDREEALKKLGFKFAGYIHSDDVEKIDIN